MLSFKTPRIEHLHKSLNHHLVFNSIYYIEDLKVFMERHIFVIWSYMSLLKSMQINFTCTRVPWVPVGDPSIRRMINELVLKEESSPLVGGLSTFEWYLQSMCDCKADTTNVNTMIDLMIEGNNSCVDLNYLPTPIKKHIITIQEIIDDGELHQLAAAFYVEREAFLSSVFIDSIYLLSNQHPKQTKSFLNFLECNYLERQLKDEYNKHGPLTLSLLTRLCTNSEQKYQECLTVIERVLESKLMLWNSVLESLTEMERQEPHRISAAF